MSSRLIPAEKKDSVPLILFIFTFVTGLVDAVSFLGLGRVFTANMTGNIVLLGFAAGGAPGLSVIRSLVALVAFLLGAVFGGRLAISTEAANKRHWLFISGISEAVLLLIAAVASLKFNIVTATPVGSLYAVIVLTGVAMGLRNGTVRKLAIPDMTTTVLTLTLTGLAADSILAGGTNPRMARRIASILLMLAGAAIGAVLIRFGPDIPLFIAGGLVLTASLLEHAKGKKS